MSKQKANIEILVVSHGPAFVPNNKLLKQIQVGTALASKKLRTAVYFDNDGEDNISNKNKSYCELTAIYWAWKNLDADYYGLFHYRRYLWFSEDSATDDSTNALPEIKPFLKRTGLANGKKAVDLIGDHDLIVPRQEDVRSHGASSAYEYYAREHNQRDLDHCLGYIEKCYPLIAQHSESLYEPMTYSYNMFIMKKDIYREYCAFLFDTLADFNRSIDTSLYNPYQSRVNGFLAERLTSIFIEYEKAQGKRIKELPTVYYHYTGRHQVFHLLARNVKNILKHMQVKGSSDKMV